MGQAGEMVKERAKAAVKEAVKGLIKKIPPIVWAWVALIVAIIITLLFILSMFIDANSLGQTSSSATGSGTTQNTCSRISVSDTNVDREFFITSVKEYNNGDADYYDRFGQYAENIYDICTNKGVNPILCVAQAGNESVFGARVPINSRWNYWGIAVYNDSNTGREFDTIDDAISAYCDIILGYQQPGSIAYNKAQIYKDYTDKITGEMDSIYDIMCAYAFLGSFHDGTIFGDVNVKTYLVDYMGYNCTHDLSEATTTEEQALYAVDYVDNHIINVARNIFGESIFSSPYNSDFYGGIEIYNSDGTTVNQEKIAELNNYITIDLLNTTIHYEGENQSGPFAKWWDPNGLVFQCPWYVVGRVNMYLELVRNTDETCPIGANGGQWHAVNQSIGWCKYGSNPKPNSIVSWTDGRNCGHVAYVEAVDPNGDIYISHAGSGDKWFGVQKVSAGRDGNYRPWSNVNYTLNGFIYLDEPK